MALSGTLPNIVDQQIGFVSDRTGLTIDSANIQTRVQSAVFQFSMASALKAMHLQAGETSVGGEISIGAAALNSAKMYEEQGMKELNSIGVKLRVYKAYG